MPENRRWKRRPAGSTWGDWGPEDQLGRLNLLMPDKVLKAVAEVKEGRTFCLSMPLDYPGGTVVNPRRKPPELLPTERNGLPNMTYPLGREDPRLLDVICDDQVLMTLQYSTQWDSLAHVGQLFDADGDGEPEIVFYNGYRAGEHIAGPVEYSHGKVIERAGGHLGATALSIDNMAAKGMQGRGVMIDLEAHFGRGEKFVSYDDRMRIMEADKIEVEEGDLVCLRTGYDRVILGMNKNPDPAVLKANPGAGLDGRDERLLNWITRSGLVALISDNVAVEAHPSRPCTEDHCASLPLHAHCLFKLGVYLGEIWLLSELADWLRAHGRSRFLLTAPPLRLPGAVGSPANAVATV